MGCGCGRSRVSTGRAVSNNNSRLVSATPPPARNLRSAAIKEVAEKQLAAKQNNFGGMDKNRREIERKRRMMILQKLGKI